MQERIVGSFARDERAIRELIDTWMAASRDGDTQTVRRAWAYSS
jgi:hypothetical protein